MRATPGVRAVERYRLEETLTPELLEAIKRGPARRTFDCMLHRIADRERIVERARVRSTGVKVLEASSLYIRFEAPADAALLAKVAYTSGVRRLDVYEPPSLMVARARSLVGADALPWTGKGELVAVFDSGIDREHPDLHDRVKSVEHLEGRDRRRPLRPRHPRRRHHRRHRRGVRAARSRASPRRPSSRSSASSTPTIAR